MGYLKISGSGMDLNVKLASLLRTPSTTPAELATRHPFPSQAAMPRTFHADFPRQPRSAQVARRPDRGSSPKPPNSTLPPGPAPLPTTPRTADKNRFAAPTISAAVESPWSGQTKTRRRTSHAPQLPDYSEGNIDYPTHTLRPHVSLAHLSLATRPGLIATNSLECLGR
jgi:hypothetical protein